MKKQLFFLFLTIISFNFYAQDDFGKGYFIDDNDNEITCLIKKVDRKNNPTEIEYKLSKNAEVQKAAVESIKEFKVDSLLKYVRASVKIDRSSSRTDKLSNERAPNFEEEELFLRVLVEGKSNLYEYLDGNLRRYFYGKEDGSIEQLVHKTYRVDANTINTNNRFRQQLWSDLKCPSITSTRVNRISYKKKDLVKLFKEYSECNDINYVIYEPKQQKFQFNLSIRPQLRNTSVAVYNHSSSFRDFDFGSKLGFGIGLEAEIILPIKRENNKWAVIVEPTFRTKYEGEKSNEIDLVAINRLDAEVMYSSIELPIGIRRYFFIGEKSKIFVNFSYVFDFHLDSSFKTIRGDAEAERNLASFSAVDNFAFGLGYKYNDKFSLEFRYHTNKDFLNWHPDLSSDYNTMAIIFGYTLF